MGFNVAIDGPAGAGKSTKEQFIYVDTGAMYRGLAVYFLDHGVSPENEGELKNACEKVKMDIRYENGVQQVYVNGENITGRLREEAVGNMASVCAAMPPVVREKLLELQRELAAAQDVIMDGRDIGTCVLPQADLKIFLTASVETRARRRYLELKEKGVACDLEEIAADIRERDERDSTRKTAPLKQAADAVLIDSSDLSIEEVVAVIASLCREKRKTPN